jgi:protein-L-isoaspartate(D-aspartate) O-methyltransferase
LSASHWSLRLRGQDWGAQTNLSEQDYDRQRQQLALQIVWEHAASDPRVLEAIRKVPRHEFVPEQYRLYAYENRPLPIGERQTISQPAMVAMMTQALDVRPTDLVLEIGAGSGYQAAILAELCRQVYTLERHEVLASKARETLLRLGYTNVEVITADGSGGLPEYAPYDRIMVSAGSPGIPDVLLDQLAVDGRLVIPVGDFSYQSLTLVDKTTEGIGQTEIAGCVFVPLIGEYGWSREQAEDR